MNRRKSFFIGLFFFLLTLRVFAVDEAHTITKVCDVRIYGEKAYTLTDDDLKTHSKLHYGTELTISSDELIGGLYVQFSVHPGSWTLCCGEKTIDCGAEGYLHEYLSDLNAYSLTLQFHGEGILANVFVLSPGEKPDWVQTWEPCWDKADVLLLPTHSDDDTLFFGGIVPWCIDKGARVQVAYLVSHDNTPYRHNELLNGLWASGLRNYPVMGEYIDTGRTESMPVYSYEKIGISYEDMLCRTVRLYRRFKPQVVICHDQNGEYGHGAHKLYFKLATDAVDAAGDMAVDIDSAVRYGVWIPPKVYAHLWKTRGVVIDLDEPLRTFDYQTGYEMTQVAFRCHQSQYADFAWYFWGAPTADKLRRYSSREYGLYYSAVGDDVSGNSFFDNLTLYDDQPPETEEEEEIETEEAAAEAEAIPTESEKLPVPVSPASDPAARQQEYIRLVFAISFLGAVVIVLFILLTKMKASKSI